MPDPYEIRPAKDDAGNPTGEFYYVELGENGQVLNTSETYVSKANAERGIEDAKARAKEDAQ